MKKLLLPLLAALCMVTSAEAKTIYVKPASQGALTSIPSDSASTTGNACTIKVANTFAIPGDKVVLLAGQYDPQNGIDWTAPTNNGKNFSHIMYVAYDWVGGNVRATPETQYGVQFSNKLSLEFGSTNRHYTVRGIKCRYGVDFGAADSVVGCTFGKKQGERTCFCFTVAWADSSVGIANYADVNEFSIQNTGSGIADTSMVPSASNTIVGNVIKNNTLNLGFLGVPGAVCGASEADTDHDAFLLKNCVSATIDSNTVSIDGSVGRALMEWKQSQYNNIRYNRFTIDLGPCNAEGANGRNFEAGVWMRDAFRWNVIQGDTLIMKGGGNPTLSNWLLAQVNGNETGIQPGYYCGLNRWDSNVFVNKARSGKGFRYKTTMLGDTLSGNIIAVREGPAYFGNVTPQDSTITASWMAVPLDSIAHNTFYSYSPYGPLSTYPGVFSLCPPQSSIGGSFYHIVGGPIRVWSNIIAASNSVGLTAVLSLEDKPSIRNGNPNHISRNYNVYFDTLSVAGDKALYYYNGTGNVYSAPGRGAPNHAWWTSTALDSASVHINPTFGAIDQLFTSDASTSTLNAAPSSSSGAVGAGFPDGYAGAIDASATDAVAPDAMNITNVLGQGSTQTVLVKWVAPADRGTPASGVARYDLRINTVAIDGDNFANSTTVSVSVTPGAPGTLESQSIHGLAQGTYWFSIKAIDAAGNTSDFGNSMRFDWTGGNTVGDHDIN